MALIEYLPLGANKNNETVAYRGQFIISVSIILIKKKGMKNISTLFENKNVKYSKFWTRYVDMRKNEFWIALLSQFSRKFDNMNKKFSLIALTFISTNRWC